MKKKNTNSNKQKIQGIDDLAKVIIILLFLLIVVASIFGYLYKWDWVGVIDNQTNKIKSLWDWMELLLIPGVFIIGAYLFNKSIKDHESKLASQRVANEHELEIDRQRQKSLEAYFDKMTDLLLNLGLRTSQDGDEVRTIARTRTLIVLREIDGKRRGHILQFLYELNLISGDKPIIDMSFADLSEIELPYANLINITLPKVNLKKANLYNAKLYNANFASSDLDDADLGWADLRNANLHCGLSRANLGVSKLDGANLSGANLDGACLINASLIGANLRYANFKYRNVYLKDTAVENIDDAKLYLADMSQCDLTMAVIDPAQLKGVKSLKDAIMPNEMKFEEWLEFMKIK